jgi:anti-sigma factor RsiW
MDHREARTHLVDRRRGTLDAASRAALESHLAGCEACRHEDAADAELSRLLEERLPRRKAPASLRRSLEARWDPPKPRRAMRMARWFAAMGAGAALAVLVLFLFRPRPPPSEDPMLTEAVNDHLRVLYSDHPIEVQSGGIHQVKPWFSGRLDFAPVVAFAGDDDFPLQGGAVSYFLDRKAAAFVFKRRLHTISLFVFRSDGLALPTGALVPMGRVSARAARVRGFNVLIWRDGELGYALVSDVDAPDLAALGAKIEP